MNLVFFYSRTINMNSLVFCSRLSVRLYRIFIIIEICSIPCCSLLRSTDFLHLHNSCLSVIDFLFQYDLSVSYTSDSGPLLFLLSTNEKLIMLIKRKEKKINSICIGFLWRKKKKKAFSFFPTENFLCKEMIRI